MSANGIYGTNVGAIVTSDDIEIYYSYSPTRNSDEVYNNKFTKLDPSSLVMCEHDDNTNNVSTTIEGLYNLKLPIKYFNKKGFYTVYIKPKEYFTVLQDVGVLSSYPDVRGLVINYEDLDEGIKSDAKTNNGLVGYRIVYYNENGTRLPYYRIITSNNKCEPIVQNLSNVNQKSVRYRYNESSSLTFLTVTPSVATEYKPNAIPFIGTSMQQVGIVNTKFEPIMIEIEMVDHDIETVSTMLEGSQLRDLDNGLITTFNSKNEIYAQHEHYTLKDEFTNEPLFEVKKNKENSIDFSQTLQDKID
jgi:hypothetical protein